MAVWKIFKKLPKVVKNENLDDTSVATANVQNKAITEPKLADGAASTRVYASGSVNEPALASSSVSTRALQNESVTDAKLAPSIKNKAFFGLGNVDNTRDVDKPISTAVQAALDTLQGVLPSGTTADYLRGDKSFVKLTSSAVLAALQEHTGTVDSATIPGVYMYSTSTGIPSGAATIGTLYVGHVSEVARSQILVDSAGAAWSRTNIGASWTTWKSMTPQALPYFYGKMHDQTHSANSEERAQITAQHSRGITVAQGVLTIPRAGKVKILATSSGGWKSNAVGQGRQLRLQHNGTRVGEAVTDVPVVWGSGLGAFSLTVSTFLSVAAGDTIEVRLAHSTNSDIKASHTVEVVWVE